MRNRRQSLRAVATVAGSAALAGCSGDGVGDGPERDGSPTGDSSQSDGTAPDGAGEAVSRAPGWVDRFGSAMNLRHNPVEGPSSAPSEARPGERAGAFDTG